MSEAENNLVAGQADLRPQPWWIDLPHTDEDMQWVFHYGRFLFYYLFRYLYPARGIGKEKLPQSGPCIVVANHQSLADPPLVASYFTQRPLKFLAKKELFDAPILGPLISNCECIPVDRKARDGSSLEAAMDVLKRDRIVAVFPEGTRSKDGRLRKGKSGAAVLALRSGAPVLPCAVYNTKDIFEHHFKPGIHPSIRVGELMHFPQEDEPGLDSIKEVRDAIMQAIAQLMELGPVEK